MGGSISGATRGEQNITLWQSQADAHTMVSHVDGNIKEWSIRVATTAHAQKH